MRESAQVTSENAYMPLNQASNISPDKNKNVSTEALNTEEDSSVGAASDQHLGSSLVSTEQADDSAISNR